NIKVYDIAISKKELEEKVKEFRRMIAIRYLFFSPRARELFDLLIKPAETDLQDKTTLCLVPDGVLWNVPFQATRKINNHYLIEDYSVYYAPSLTALKILSSPRSNGINKTNSLLSLANPSVKKSVVSDLEVAQRAGNFQPLPEAETEVKKIGQLFPVNQSKSFIGEAAT